MRIIQIGRRREFEIRAGSSGKKKDKQDLTNPIGERMPRHGEPLGHEGERQQQRRPLGNENIVHFASSASSVSRFLHSLLQVPTSLSL